MFGERELRHLIDIRGADHIMLRTDYPFDIAESDPAGFVGRVKSVSEKNIALVGGGNAARLLSYLATKRTIICDDALHRLQNSVTSQRMRISDASGC